MNPLLQPYDPEKTETKIYKTWEESGFFNPDNLPARHEKSFTIIMPPPNANGHLHAGHALFITLEDIMTRFKRMRGYKALWVPGADHAGFETQIVYEKKLEKEGRSRFHMTPEELYKEIYAFTIENKAHMENEVRRLGASCDWSRETFTLEPKVVEEVQRTFKKMYDDGLVYRGKRIVNWCSKHQTTLSDVETTTEEKKDKFYYFQYGPFVISTARPETKFGDKYVVMHPDDPRYSQYKNGDTFETEWINGKITATVIKDEAIDMEFGTGVMTITPWHDATDFGLAQKYNLPKEQVIDFKGKLLPIAGEFAGMKIAEARPLIVEKLKAKGLLVKVDENYVHNVPCCYKCNTVIEPQVMDQWFVKMEPLSKLALKAVDDKQITFIPDNYEKIFRYWMENTIDWNISRQIVWGIPIPAKICTSCDHAFPDLSDTATTCPKCNSTEIRKDTDTFDTWFSSGQWPLLSLGYSKSDDWKTFHPTDIMETGHDLIFKWVPRMVIFSLYLEKQVPFHTVYLHGLVNDAKGQKMSKSKGNVINPIEIIEKFGTDALRMALIVGNTPGTDMSLADNKIKGYKNFANKLWNIARFVHTSSEGKSLDLENLESTITEESDKQLLAELTATVKDVTTDFEEHRYHLAANKIYHYVWHSFADKILEESKPILNGETITSEAKLSRLATLNLILKTSLITLHPLMPFVTEELWAIMGYNKNSLLMIEPWSLLR
jgi:valyl-tRNA synthetase